jgi:cytochrome c553
MTAVLLALLATAVLTTAVAIAATPHTRPAPPVPLCDLCGRPSTRRTALITHPDDSFPSHWAACPDCHLRHRTKETADVRTR